MKLITHELYRTSRLSDLAALRHSGPWRKRSGASGLFVLYQQRATLTEGSHITTATMAANAQKTVDWAEDGEPDLATAIPAPQVSKNKDGTETVVTIFINEDGKKVKRTQRIRRTVVKKKENPRVAERRAWTKIGEEAGKPAGPGDTTTLGENIMFKPVAGFKAGGAQEKAPEEDKKADALKKMQIKCRICSGDHFTTKCPFKDTMAPAGEDAAPADMAAAEGGESAAGGLSGATGGYVPPHLRKGGAGTTGERMGGKFERDDLATLRVTNVRHIGNLENNSASTNISCPGLRIRRRKRPPRDLRAPRPRHSCLPGQGPRDRPRQGLCFRFLRRPHRCCSGLRACGRLRFRPLDSQGGVCEEGRRQEIGDSRWAMAGHDMKWFSRRIDEKAFRACSEKCLPFYDF